MSRMELLCTNICCYPPRLPSLEADLAAALAIGNFLGWCYPEPWPCPWCGGESWLEPLAGRAWCGDCMDDGTFSLTEWNRRASLTL